MTFEFWQCTDADQETFRTLIGSLDREPDLVIADDVGEPYLYRWHVVPRSRECNVYAHIQVASDPARPMHDHPWDNVSVILAGGYFEKLCMYPRDTEWREKHALVHKRSKGDSVARKAQWAHRLIMPVNVQYTMTLFSTGPKVNEWGFWTGDKKQPWEEVTRLDGNASLWTGPKLPEEHHAPYCL